MINKNIKNTRYPGVEPFSVEQKEVFKGRAKDAQALYDLLIRQNTTLLYAKSGLGKSSLINAGLIPLLEESKQNIEPIFLRLRAYSEGASILPVQNVIENLPIPEDFQSEWLDKITPNKNTLWYHIRQLTLANPDKSYLFVFDQFEELFSYPTLAINQFKKQLADVLYKDAPESVWESYDQQEEALNLSDAELDVLEEKLPLKVLFAIREDKYSLLNQLSDSLPSITQNRYQIQPLSNAQAQDAIILPAQEAGNFASEAFTYTPKAVQAIMQFLTKDGTQAVETTQLQILCNRIESLGLREVKETDIPDFEDIFLDFYKGTLAEIPENERLQSQRFIENELIRKGQRISLDRVICLEKVSEQTLNILVDKHLLRAERNTVGGFSYEIAHDTLVEPISQAKKTREAKEEEARAKQERLEEERRLKEQSEKDRQEKLKIQKQLRNTRLLLAGAFLGLVIAVVAVIFAVQAQAKAKEEEGKAKTALAQAKESEKRAKSKEKEALEAKKLAEDKTQETEEALKDLEEQTGKTRRALSDKEKEEQKRKQAEEAQKIEEERTRVETAINRAKSLPDKSGIRDLEALKRNIVYPQNLQMIKQAIQELKAR